MFKHIDVTLNSIFNTLSASETIVRLLFIMDPFCLDKGKFDLISTDTGWVVFDKGENRNYSIENKDLFHKTPYMNLVDQSFQHGFVGFFLMTQARSKYNISDLLSIISVSYAFPKDHEVLVGDKSRTIQLAEAITAELEQITHRNSKLLYTDSSLAGFEQKYIGYELTFSALDSQTNEND